MHKYKSKLINLSTLIFVFQVLESLPGIESLREYTFKYGRNPMLELPLAVNPTGCARAEPKMHTNIKRVHNFQV